MSISIEAATERIKSAKTDEEIKEILRTIYNGGFEDGRGEPCACEDSEPPDYNDLD